ncbi:MAG: hypothetical protein C4524_01925 [Candidatus Zixiibacteriota bacterium]|nr:MAG: hypothetical protein C4524_01925 [candidate division Zixibacteria bacterium]
MPWKKADPELDRLLEAALSSHPVRRKPMFGCPAWFLNGRLMAGVFQDRLFLRLSPDDRQALFAAHDEAAPFEPRAGRPMREYANLPEALSRDAAALEEWVRCAANYAVSLPPKLEKRRK